MQEHNTSSSSSSTSPFEEFMQANKIRAQLEAKKYSGNNLTNIINSIEKEYNLFTHNKVDLSGLRSLINAHFIDSTIKDIGSKNTNFIFSCANHIVNKAIASNTPPMQHNQQNNDNLFKDGTLAYIHSEVTGGKSAPPSLTTNNSFTSTSASSSSSSAFASQNSGTNSPSTSDDALNLDIINPNEWAASFDEIIDAIPLTIHTNQNTSSSKREREETEAVNAGSNVGGAAAVKRQQTNSSSNHRYSTRSSARTPQAIETQELNKSIGDAVQNARKSQEQQNRSQQPGKEWSTLIRKQESNKGNRSLNKPN